MSRCDSHCYIYRCEQASGHSGVHRNFEGDRDLLWEDRGGKELPGSPSVLEQCYRRISSMLSDCDSVEYNQGLAEALAVIRAMQEEIEP